MLPDDAVAGRAVVGADDAARLLAVDGNSLGHRAFHAARADAEPGVPFVTGAVVSMLASAWTEGPYDGVVIAFDHADNRRKASHPEYKANRADHDPDIAGHLATLRMHLADCGWLVLDHPGSEADDLLAATADACEQRGWQCDVLSSDRDLTALVGPSVRLLRPRARFADLAVEDEATVLATYGVTPAQYTQFAALRGDPSDGLTGARGIGPKTAARLLRDHGSIAAMYTSLTDLPPRIEAALREGRDRVERNLELMAPIPHLEVDVEVARATGIDADRVHAVLEPLGLGAAARRLARAVSAPPAPPLPPPPTQPPPAVDRSASVDPPPTGDGRASPGAATHRPAATIVSPSDGEQVPLF